MRSLARLALAFAIVSTAVPALAQDFARQRELNALKDIESSQRAQTEIMRLQAQRDSERAYKERNAYVNAKRDARSMRRFDRP